MLVLFCWPFSLYHTNLDYVSIFQVWSSVQVMAAEVLQLYNYQGMATMCQSFFATCFLGSYCHQKFQFYHSPHYHVKSSVNQPVNMPRGAVRYQDKK